MSDEIDRIIGILAALILAGSALRSKRIPIADRLRMAMIWLMIFAAAGLIFTLTT